MADFLFLVESRAKAETLKHIVGDQIEVVVLTGRPASFSIRPQGQTGASVFSFQPVAAVWSDVFERITNYKDVYYCFDTSVDGENLSYFVDQLLQAASSNVQGHRLSLAGFTGDLITESKQLVEPLSEDQCVRSLQHDLFHKVFFSHLARLLGTAEGPGHVELSIATLSLLSMLAEKHHSLSSVVRQPKWEVEVGFSQDGKDVNGRLAEVYGVSSDGILATGKEAKELAATIKESEFSLVERSDNEVLFPCPSLYTLPELVFDAYRFFQILPGDVLSGVGELFSGVDTGHGKVGLISSPYGVSSPNMQSVFEGLCQFVSGAYGENGQVKPDFGDGVILPLDLEVHPENVQLPTTLKSLYELIWLRSVASQMADGVGCDSKVTFESSGRRVQFSSLTLIKEGFLAVCKHGYETVFSDTQAAIFKEGESVVVEKAVVHQVHPQGMSHYHILSLCEDLREMGFDDEKFILTVFQQLLDQKYVMLSGDGEIVCTDTLLKVISTIDRAFPGMKGLNLSAYYAQTVEEVMSGRKRVDVALKQFDQNLVMQGVPLVKVKVPVSIPKLKRKSKNVIKGGQGKVKGHGGIIEGFSDFNDTPEDSAVVDETLSVAEEHTPDAALVVDDPVDAIVVPEVPPEVVETEEEIPEEIVVEPELIEESVEVDVEESCEDVFEQPAPVEEDIVEVAPLLSVESVDLSAVETMTCPECSRPMVVKDDRFGKFWSCTGMPACHHSETYQKKEEVVQVQSCPVCKRGALSVNRTPAGKDMYICNDSACEFMAWAKPHAIDCPLCGSPFLIQKKDRMGNVSLRCPMAGCSYVHGGVADDKKPSKPKKKKVRVRRKKSGASGGKKRRVVRRKKKV